MTGDPTETAGIDRRPISARRVVVFHALAAALARRRVSPNVISIAGLIFAGGAAACLALTDSTTLQDRLLFIGAACFIQLRLLANLLDGLVAIEGGLKSPSGELFNEVPDRVSDVLVLIGAGYATGSTPTMGWLAALLALFVAYVRVFGRSLGLHADYRGPMAKQQRMFLVTVVCVMMAAMPTRWLPMFPATYDDIDRGLLWMVLALIVIGCIVTAARRLMHIITSLRRSGSKSHNAKTAFGDPTSNPRSPSSGA